MSELIALTRQLTGTASIHHSYVGNQITGRIVRSCQHNHRSTRTARNCADRMLAVTESETSHRRMAIQIQDEQANDAVTDSQIEEAERNL